MSYQYGIKSMGDIISAQYHHYFGWGGRVIVHGLLQIFTSLCDKIVYDIANTLIFALFIYLTISIVDKSLCKNPYAWGGVAIGVTFLLPAHSAFYSTGALALNYLWGITFCLLFIYIWKYYKFKSWGGTIALFLPCFIMGWSQELFALPIAGAICIYYLINRKEIFTQRTVLSFAFCLGVLILVIAPGNFVRLDGASSGLSNLLKLASRLYESPSIFVLLAVTIYFVYKVKLKSIVPILRDHLLYTLIFIISLLFCFMFPASGTRSLIGVMYWWIIIFAIILLPKITTSKINKWIYGILYTTMIVLAISVGYYSNISSNHLNNLVSKFVESEQGVVFLDAPHIPSILKSSVADVHRPVNKEAIAYCYGDSRKSLFLVNESIEKTIDNLTSQVSEKDSTPIFYSTDMPDYYILRNYEQYEDDLDVTYSGADSDAKIVRMVLERIMPNRYMPFNNKLESGNLVYLDYNGERVGIMFNPYDTRQVVAVTPFNKRD